VSIQVEVTATSQLKSANAESEIAHHSGKENRDKWQHANENIDASRSHMNQVFQPFDREELLEKHYREKIDKHNKNNNSKSRRWDTMDEFLKSFEGKAVKMRGKDTKNVRWATASQISYFGGKDSLGELIDEMQEHGVPEEQIQEAYTAGYGEYIDRHNEHFPTLPIYRSDVHYDEAVPHGHDAIVVMGHTQAGKPSDSLNNALGEMYGYPKDWDGKKANLERYRAENDDIIFTSIGPKLEEVAENHGIDISFSFLRTGAEGGKDMPEYKQNQDLQAREDELEDGNNMLKHGRNYQKEQAKKLKEDRKQLAARERTLDERENQLENERETMIAEVTRAMEEKKEKVMEELKEREEKIKQREAEILRQEENVKMQNAAATAATLAILRGDPKREAHYKAVRQKGVGGFSPEAIQNTVIESLNDIDKGLRKRTVGGDFVIKGSTKRIMSEQKDNEGPEL
jgi:hypothetical protein